MNQPPGNLPPNLAAPPAGPDRPKTVNPIDPSVFAPMHRTVQENEGFAFQMKYALAAALVALAGLAINL